LLLADDLPASLKNAKDQFYNWLLTWTQGQGMADSQKLVLNSLILPFDIATDTPFHNDEIFRQYADRTFHGGTENITGSAPASMAERFSSQYQAVLNQAAQRVDQNHPEIKHKLAQLRADQAAATKAYTEKITDLETQWGKVAAARALIRDTPEYALERVAIHVRAGNAVRGELICRSKRRAGVDVFAIVSTEHRCMFRNESGQFSCGIGKITNHIFQCFVPFHFRMPIFRAQTG
jgi:hypothetical protein